MIRRFVYFNKIEDFDIFAIQSTVISVFHTSAYMTVLLQRFIVRWGYVAGHRGIVGNEGADELARAGAIMYSRDQ